jgi:glycosyltransferase involved in cell wall biosynthesis
MSSPERLWRPIVLALHELVEQADRFESRLTTLGHAIPVGGGSDAALAPEVTPVERRRPSRIEADRVSVIVPVFDDHPELEEAIASLAEQTYAEVEILVVHDAARTARCESLRALPLSNIKVIAHPGPYVDALNAAVEAATGAYVVVHGADDRSHPQRLARQVAYLQAHGDVGVLATAAGTLDDPARGSDPDDLPLWTPDALESRLRSGPAFAHGSAIARRSAVRQAGGYRRRAGSPPDHDLWLRLLPETRFAKLPTRLYFRRARG